MNSHYRLKYPTALIASLLIASVLAGCAARQAYNRGSQDQLTQDYEAAMLNYKKALDSDPTNVSYRLRYQQARFSATLDHVEKGRRAFDRNDLAMAQAEYKRALEIDPSYDEAIVELKKIDAALQSRANKTAEPDRTFDEMKADSQTDPNPVDQLDVKTIAPLTLKMTQDSRVLFETIASFAGLNVIFDQTFRGARVPIELTDVTVFEALDLLSLQTGSFWEPLNKNTIIVSPDNQTKRRDYEPQILKTLYLANTVTATEITEAISAIRTLLNMRYVAQITAMNAIIVRGPPDQVAIAERIVDMIDKSKPEVVVEVTVLEVDVNKALTLGLQPPNGTNLTFATPAQAAAAATTTTTPSTTTTSSTTTSTASTATSSITGNTVQLNNLRNAFGTGNFSLTIPTVVAAALASNSLSTLLQNPSIRATDGKKAELRIGSKIPVPSGSFQPTFAGSTGTPVVQFQYYDVGVNVDVTPHVLLNRQIALTVNIAVQALAGEQNVGGLNLPVITNRSVVHDISLNEGETNVLGGIISDTESKSMSGIPGLMNIPILKYFFGQKSDSGTKSEVIIMLTPHIVRMPDITLEDMHGLNIGTESQTKLKEPTVPPPAPAATPAPAAATSAPATSAPAPATVPAAAPPVITTPARPVVPAPPPRPPQRQTSATLSFDPGVSVEPGQPKPLNLRINGTDIDSVDLTLSFDPAAISIQTPIRDGGFLSRDGQILAVVQNVDSETGIAKITLERPPGAPAIAGNGSLITLMLVAGSKKGDAIIKVTDFAVRDAQQNVGVGKPVEARITVH